VTDRPFREVVDALKSAPRDLRGSTKLRPALDAFGVAVEGKTCLDVGASTGGFTTVLLERGAARVYAVDAGHGQLLGSLRQDPRVTNLEATNVGELTRTLVPGTVELVTVDVSYLALGEAIAQLASLDLDPGCELVGLVKPMFELRLAQAPTDEDLLAEATERACADARQAGWTVAATMTSTQRGSKGAIEGFIHAQRTPGSR
jgi:23S rRNA (cytidine1920-2'-O)/16S rRNA (cytidine1409-2'-O)-methyltransferase